MGSKYLSADINPAQINKAITKRELTACPELKIPLMVCSLRLLSG
jgi:hypothetical protein